MKRNWFLLEFIILIWSVRYRSWYQELRIYQVNNYQPYGLFKPFFFHSAYEKRKKQNANAIEWLPTPVSPPYTYQQGRKRADTYIYIPVSKPNKYTGRVDSSNPIIDAYNDIVSTRRLTPTEDDTHAQLFSDASPLFFFMIVGENSLDFINMK